MRQAQVNVDLHIGQRQGQLRLTRGITEADFAGGIGTSVTQLRLIEKGHKRAAPQQLLKAAEMLKVSIGRFFEDAPVFTGQLSITGVNADVARFLSMPEAYDLMSAFIKLSTKSQRQAAVEEVRFLAAKDNDLTNLR